MSADDAFDARLERAAGVAVERAVLAGRDAPVRLVAPDAEDGLAEVLRLCSAEGRRVLPLGSGSKLAWAPPAGAVDVALSTRGVAGIVAHEPADGTITALAGTAVADLAAAAAAHGGAVTPLLAAPAGATLGGVLSSGQDGLDRLRHGAPRDHVLGARLARADGTTFQSGGRLVKNVTGYDLHRLICGAHGTLALVLEATLRLFPAPTATARVRAWFPDLAAAVEAALTHARPADLPRRVVARPDGGRWQLAIDLAAGAAEVDEQRRRLLEALPGAEADELPPPGDDDVPPPPRDVVTTRPSRLVATALALAEHGERAPTVLAVEPCLGRLWLRPASPANPANPANPEPAPPPAPPTDGPAAALADRVRRALDPRQILATRGS